MVLVDSDWSDKGYKPQRKSDSCIDPRRRGTLHLGETKISREDRKETRRSLNLIEAARAAAQQDEYDKPNWVTAAANRRGSMMRGRELSMGGALSSGGEGQSLDERLIRGLPIAESTVVKPPVTPEPQMPARRFRRASFTARIDDIVAASAGSGAAGFHRLAQTVSGDSEVDRQERIAKEKREVDSRLAYLANKQAQAEAAAQRADHQRRLREKMGKHARRPQIEPGTLTRSVLA